MKKFILAITLLSVFTLTSAYATTFSIDTIDGDWINANPSSSVTSINNSGNDGGLSSVRWSDSGYDFESLSTPLEADSGGAVFEIGTFTHQNYPIYSSSISSIELSLTIKDIGIFDINSSFTFNHDETSNSASPASNPLNNDIVEIDNPIINYLFEYEGSNYYFNLLGFSQDGGQTIATEFSTIEGVSNTASLYATITEVPISGGGSSAPEPTTMILFGLGLLGLAGVSRKKTA